MNSLLINELTKCWSLSQPACVKLTLTSDQQSRLVHILSPKAVPLSSINLEEVCTESELSFVHHLFILNRCLDNLRDPSALNIKEDMVEYSLDSEEYHCLLPFLNKLI